MEKIFAMHFDSPASFVVSGDIRAFFALLIPSYHAKYIHFI